IETIWSVQVPGPRTGKARPNCWPGFAWKVSDAGSPGPVSLTCTSVPAGMPSMVTLRLRVAPWQMFSAAGHPSSLWGMVTVVGGSVPEGVVDVDAVGVVVGAVGGVLLADSWGWRYSGSCAAHVLTGSEVKAARRPLARSEAPGVAAQAVKPF